MNSNLSVEISRYSVQARGETPHLTPSPEDGGSDYKTLLLERPVSVESEQLWGVEGSRPGLGRPEGQEKHKEPFKAPGHFNPWMDGFMLALSGGSQVSPTILRTRIIRSRGK